MYTFFNVQFLLTLTVYNAYIQYNSNFRKSSDTITTLVIFGVAIVYE